MSFIRRLGDCDRALVKAHYRRLNGEDRFLRFGHGVSGAAIEHYIDGIDWGRAIVLGYVEAGELRGVVEVMPLSDGYFAREAELALTVQRPWRNQGLGTELCRRALVLACNRSIREVAMICLAENVPMQRIAERLKARVVRRDGEVESRLLLPDPTPWSILQESLISGAAIMGVVSDQGLPGHERGEAHACSTSL